MTRDSEGGAYSQGEVAAKAAPEIAWLTFELKKSRGCMTLSLTWIMTMMKEDWKPINYQ